jgi:hypothetical protein
MIVRGVVERPGRCYPAAVLVEPAIACFGRVRALCVLWINRGILQEHLPESQSSATTGENITAISARL